ncbi:MAG: type VII toxin-antitoxin system MntA family adenylyltransferase antitoxin [Thermodesulfobacteriota bacterium]
MEWGNSLTMNHSLLEILKNYFINRKDIVFAFLFGSAVYGKIRKEGDIDIGIYLWPEGDIEWEEFNKKYKGENEIALDLERILKQEVDLVVLNRSKAIVADEIIRKGTPIIIKDQKIFWEFFCLISDEAERMRNWIEAIYEEKKLELR